MDKNSPKIGLVSLGCPKALVDSEVLINKLQTLGYGISQTYDNADAVVVNTCGSVSYTHLTLPTTPYV